MKKNSLEKKSEEWAFSRTKDKTERATGGGRRTREEIKKKVELNNIPEIPNRRETSDIPGLSSR